MSGLETKEGSQGGDRNDDSFSPADDLTNEEIRRYGRQLILPGWGKQAQLNLRNTSILVVGAGGLGSPACLYLGAGGIGRLGIVDNDTVDISNLHRQVIHTEQRQGVSKAVSAMQAIHAVNPSCKVVPYELTLDSENALQIIQQYDIIVDATDNLPTRYLLNDASVLAGKPLVSGSALRYDGQLITYNYEGGPCFRCINPVPPPPDSVGKCVDSGVLGAVTGVIGTLQALEAMKIAAGVRENTPPNFLIFSALSYPMIRTIKMRSRNKNCPMCGDNPSITKLIDYVQFCQSGISDKNEELSLLGPEERISVKDYHSVISKGDPHVLLDVRPKVQFDICCLPNSVNIPIDNLEKEINKVEDAMKDKGVAGKDVYVICRLGNDSQLAVRTLEKHKIAGTRDITGGILQWATDVDPDFPIY